MCLVTQRCCSSHFTRHADSSYESSIVGASIHTGRSLHQTIRLCAVTQAAIVWNSQVKLTNGPCSFNKLFIYAKWILLGRKLIGMDFVCAHSALLWAGNTRICCAHFYHRNNFLSEVTHYLHYSYKIFKSIKSTKFAHKFTGFMCFISILLRNFLHVAVPGLTVIAALLVVLFQISMVCTCILDATGWSTDLVYGAIGANAFQIRTSLLWNSH